MPNSEHLPLDVEASNRFEAIRRSIILAFAAAALAGCVQATPNRREGEFKVLPSQQPTATLDIPPVNPQGGYDVFVPWLSNKEQKQQLGNEILKNTYEIVDRLITESLNKDLLAEYEGMLKSNSDIETIKNFFIQKLPNFQSNLMTKVSAYLDTIKI